MNYTKTFIPQQTDDDKQLELNRSLDEEFTKISTALEPVKISFTSNGVADTETTVAHSLGRVPTGVYVYEQDKAGSLYKSKAFDANNIYMKSDVATVAFKVIVF